MDEKLLCLQLKVGFLKRLCKELDLVFHGLCGDVTGLIDRSELARAHVVEIVGVHRDIILQIDMKDW